MLTTEREKRQEDIRTEWRDRKRPIGTGRKEIRSKKRMKEVKYEERTGETKEENRSRAEGVVMRGPACITLLHCKSGRFFYTWVGLQSGRIY